MARRRQEEDAAAAMLAPTPSDPAVSTAVNTNRGKWGAVNPRRSSTVKCCRSDGGFDVAAGSSAITKVCCALRDGLTDRSTR